jgi:hypothetical protein
LDCVGFGIFASRPSILIRQPAAGLSAFKPPNR